MMPPDAGGGVAPITVQEGLDFAADDRLDIGGVGEGLVHLRGVDVRLHARLAACQQVALEAGRDVEREGERPTSMPASICCRLITSGGMNCGEWKALMMRADSGDWSSSTIASGALLSVSDMPVAAV
ncbi:MAG TPA: hypothetical protein VL051_15570 [Burkholderiaceae bacterium]|nr:hypothetical protein [Burkholderiaceae bacterium]